MSGNRGRSHRTSNPAAVAAIRAYLERRAEDMSGDVYPFLVLARATKASSRGELATLLRAAERDPLAFDACALLVDQKHEGGDPMPGPLRRFVSDVLHGKRCRPRRRGGGSRYRNLARDYVVRMALFVGKKHGLPPTTSNSEIAGCDVVAEWMREAGIALKASSIAKIWEKRRYD